jgi:thiol-disulfide isomerase/thioredoxin
MNKILAIKKSTFMKILTRAGLWLAGLITSIIAVAQTDSHNSFTIHGAVTGDTHGADKIYVYVRHEYSDSTMLKDGHYSITIPFKEAEFVSIVPEYVLTRHSGYQPYGVLVDRPGTYTFESDVSKKLIESRIGGSTATLAFDKFNEGEQVLYDTMRAIVKTLNIPNSDSKTLEHVYDSLSHSYLKPFIGKFIGDHPDNFAAVYVLQSQGLYVLDIEDRQKMYATLSPTLQHTDLGKKIKESIEGTINGSVGHQVAAFTLADSLDRQVSFSGFKGKYLLIDFWASWCGPCRASFPHMREVYQKLHGVQFEMLSVSIDKSRPSWLKAMREEKNGWPQVLDTKDIAESHFGVTAIPTLFLLDPNGRILAREEGFDPDGNGTIERKLSELHLSGQHRQ